MEREVQWAFAYSNDLQREVHISEVCKGNACNCVCLQCGGEMQARKGEERAFHFKHIDSDCGGAENQNESALHKFAKRLFQRRDSIQLPAYILAGKLDLQYNADDRRQLASFEYEGSKEFFYSKVHLEDKTYHEFTPDVILEAKSGLLLCVEIAVTHYVEKEKTQKYRARNISCLEIDLSSLKKKLYVLENLEEELNKIIFEELKYKQWIYHKNEKNALSALRKRNEKLEEEYQRQNKISIGKFDEVGNGAGWRDPRISTPPITRRLPPTIQANEILEKLNEEQIKPVLETEGAVLVLAGAGSGKTRVLTSRIAYILEEKRVSSEAILAITFTNKAANEMKERLFRITDISRSWVCTIHSMCVRILRMFAREAGLQENFSIYSETERNNIIKKSFQECDFDDEKLLKTVKFHIANAKMLGFSPDRYAQEYAGDHHIEEVTKVYTRYQKHLRENNALDFDDLLNETRLLLKTNEEAREYLSGRFRYILVDEFQDTNAVQYEIIKMLASVHGNLFAVGDDDQSIYGWRGAKIENILHFEKDFKGAKVFKLERNYRSTKTILNLANTVIKNNGRRKDKTLWTENPEGDPAKVYEAEEESGEARYIAHTIAGLVSRGYRYSDFAVLMRLNALTRSLEQEFTADGIPFKVFGGFKFFERKEIKDLLAYLRLINNPFDSEAAIRIINFPKRGIGAKTVETLQNYAFENELSVYDALFDLDELGFTGATKQKLENFRTLVKGWIVESQDMPVNELVKKIVVDTKMREAYADDSDESINKRANIEEFINSVDEYCRLNQGASLTDYLNQVTLASDTDDMDDGNYVSLATIHSVKGLEFKCVFLCGMEENILPVSRAVGNDDDMEEERRLTYVAITRAMKRIYLTRSKSRYLYGKREPTMRSRFLKELSSELDLPKETRYTPLGYDGFDDPESYGNSSYGGGRYGSNVGYGGYNNRANYGGSSYGGSSYGGYGSRSSERENSQIKRSAWNGSSSYGSYGNSSYGSSSYGNSSYGNSSYGGASSGYGRAAGAKKEGGFTYGGISRAGARPATGGKDLSAFKTGVKVKHPKFGVGTIVMVKGVGANTILDIAFAGLGIKQLSANLAPLTVLG